MRDSIASGVAADEAWAARIDEEIDVYSAAGEEYMTARAADLRDLRDRVLRALSGSGLSETVPEAPSCLPPT